jgi:galactokinase
VNGPILDVRPSDGPRGSAQRAVAERLAAAFPASGPAGLYVAFVPGRIEVLGKHTDYAGGKSLLCAVEQGFTIVARARCDDRVHILAADTGERFDSVLSADVEPRAGHWGNYPATVIRRVARNFPERRVGADVAFSSNLPPAAGMSSSSAMMIAVLAALGHVNRIDETPQYRAAIASRLDLAAFAATIENGHSFGPLAGDRGVGTCGGSEDHTAILCCEAGRLTTYAFCPVRFQGDVAWPEGWVFVVANSGVAAEKAGAARDRYNRASRLAADVLAIWNHETGRTDPSLEAAVSGAWDAPDRLVEVLEGCAGAAWPREMLVGRARQFCLESVKLIPAANRALSRGDLTTFGALVERSQAAAEQWLANQVPETIELTRDARACGAVAASAFGAGFGGSVWAMVREDQADTFIDTWRTRYVARFPDAGARSAFVVTRPGPAACALV